MYVYSKNSYKDSLQLQTGSDIKCQQICQLDLPALHESQRKDIDFPYITLIARSHKTTQDENKMKQFVLFTSMRLAVVSP